MRRVLKSPWAWVGAVVTLLILWPLTARLRGALMAHIDHARGHYEVQTFGLPGDEEETYRRLLAEKYGVRLNLVAGCVVWPWEVAYIDGYNAVSKRLLTEKYGQDIAMECWGWPGKQRTPNGKQGEAPLPFAYQSTGRLTQFTSANYLHLRQRLL